MNIFSKKTGKQIDRCEALTLMLMLVAIGWTMPSPHSYFATQRHTTTHYAITMPHCAITMPHCAIATFSHSSGCQKKWHQVTTGHWPGFLTKKYDFKIEVDIFNIGDFIVIIIIIIITIAWVMKWNGFYYRLNAVVGARSQVALPLGFSQHQSLIELWAQ